MTWIILVAWIIFLVILIKSVSNKNKKVNWSSEKNINYDIELIKEINETLKQALKQRKQELEDLKDEKKWKASQKIGHKINRTEELDHTVQQSEQELEKLKKELDSPYSKDKILENKDSNIVEGCDNYLQKTVPWRAPIIVNPPPIKFRKRNFSIHIKDSLTSLVTGTYNRCKSLVDKVTSTLTTNDKQGITLNDSGIIKIAVNKIMGIKKPEFIEVLISADLDEINKNLHKHLYDDFEDEAITTEQIKISQLMKVELVAKNFDIKAQSEGIQAVKQNAVGVWRWEVTPKALKEQKILIEVYAMFFLGYNREIPVKLKTFTKSIKVRVTLSHILDKYKAEITAIVIALLGTGSYFNWDKIKSFLGIQ